MINNNIKIIINRINYLISSLIKLIFRQGLKCHYCKSSDYKVISKKYMVTFLVRCENCKFLYRIPTTTYKENKKFYQKNYSGGGQSMKFDKKKFTTNLPSESELKNLIKTNFANSEKDYTKYTDILKIIKNSRNLKLFDYGCSWGYGSYQIQKSGFEVSSFEISDIRAEFAQKELGINIIKDIENVKSNDYDIFFSSHVLEHLPNINQTIEFGFRILKKDGLFIAFTPNGSKEHKKINKNWDKLWGLNHPNFLDEIFYKKIFENKTIFITSDIQKSSKEFENFLKNKISYSGNLNDFELMCVVRNS